MANSNATLNFIEDVTNYRDEYIVMTDWFLDRIFAVAPNNTIRVYGIVGGENEDSMYEDWMLVDTITSDKTLSPALAKKLAKEYIDSIYNTMEDELCLGNPKDINGVFSG